MGKEYGVDLDALDQVVKELNQVLNDMGGPKDKAKNQTFLPDGALGKGSEERDQMHNAHNKMKDYIETNIVALIEHMIDDFGKKSKQTKDAYEDAEHDNTMK